jgi:hypothetical protein
MLTDLVFSLRAQGSELERPSFREHFQQWLTYCWHDGRTRLVRSFTESHTKLVFNALLFDRLKLTGGLEIGFTLFIVPPDEASGAKRGRRHAA